MSLQLPPDLSASVQHFIAFEGYKTEEAVLRDALDALDALEEKANIAAIQAGIDDMEAGRMQPWKEVKEELRAQLGIKRP
jgi:predicted transcriptional regulator